MLEFEWDKNKNEANFKKHGIKFDEAICIFEGKVLTSADERNDYGEQRWISIGEIEGVAVIVLIHTDRHNKLRIISARKANKKERRKYSGYIQEKN